MECTYQGIPRKVRDSIRVAVGISSTDRGDRPPALEEVLVPEVRDVGVRRSQVEKRKEARILPEIKAVLDRDNSRDPVPSLGSSFHPEQGDLGLFSGARGAVHGAQTLHLIEIRRVFLAGHGIGRLRPVLRAGAEHDGSDVSPSCKQGSSGRDHRVARRGAQPSQPAGAELKHPLVARTLLLEFV